MAWAKFFFRQTSLANGIHTADLEREMNATAGGSELDVSNTLSAGAARTTHVWTTASGVPNDGDWPDGDYDYSPDISAGSADNDFGFKTLNAVAGHVARVNSGVTSDLQTNEFNTTHAGTGVKTETKSLTWSMGAAGDRAEMLLVTHHARGHGNTANEVRYSSSSFINPPAPAPDRAPRSRLQKPVHPPLQRARYAA